jgi:hypothetical protein
MLMTSSFVSNDALTNGVDRSVDTLVDLLLVVSSCSWVLWSAVGRHSCFPDVVGVVVVFNDRFGGSFFLFFLLGAASVTPVVPVLSSLILFLVVRCFESVAATSTLLLFCLLVVLMTSSLSSCGGSLSLTPMEDLLSLLASLLRFTGGSLL